METDAPMIRVEHFTAAYEGTIVIEDISFEVARGEACPQISFGPRPGKSS